MSLSCERCGEELAGTETRDGSPVWWDGDEVTCPCGTWHQIAVNDDRCDEDDDLGTAYVQNWRCRHGYDEAIPCPACDAEDDAAAAAAPPADEET